MKALLLEDLIRNTGKSEEEVIEEMKSLGYEPFHLFWGRSFGKIAFRKKRDEFSH
jgi:hypothetical protein